MKRTSKNPFIRISEEEIAHDYPLPAQYEKEEEEVDELMMADCIEFLDPEQLPQRTLTDFAIYNSEVCFIVLCNYESWPKPFDWISMQVLSAFWVKSCSAMAAKFFQTVFHQPISTITR